MPRPTFEAFDPFDRSALQGTLAAARGKRQHRRVKLQLPARFVLPDGVERGGLVTDLSIRGANVIAETSAILGDRVTLFISDLGRIEGEVMRVTPRGFGVLLSGDRIARIARADALTVFLQRPPSTTRATRYPQAKETVVETQDGSLAHCVITDISTTGASIACVIQPPVGEKVRIGRKRAEVVRHFEGGFGVRFPKRPS